MTLKTKLRKIYFAFSRQRLKNKSFTLISNNCLAGCVLHDFSMRFDTPTINLFIPFPDYIKFLTNLKNYVSKDIEDITGDSPYPIGLLGGVIHLHFLHYKSFDEAVDAWKRRCRRIHWDNLRIVLVERDGCTESDLKAFDELPYSHKIALVHKDYSNIKSSFLIKGFEDCSELGNVMTFVNSLGRKHYDQFNWRQFLNQNI